MSNPISTTATPTAQEGVSQPSAHVDSIEHLAHRRWRIAAVLTGGVLFSYFGFIFLVAFNKEGMGTELTPGLSVGILLGALVIAVSFGLTTFFVRWSNVNFDRQLAVLKADRREP